MEAHFIDFDVILNQIGGMGLYQITLYTLLVIPATLPAAFVAFNQVFISAVPEHWCKVSELLLYQRSHSNFSLEIMKNLSIPRKGFLFSKCHQYDVNFTEILTQEENQFLWRPSSSWNITKCKEGWSYDQTEFENTLVTQLDLVCEYHWWPSTSTALFYVGSLLGNIIFGLSSDKYGRKPTFFLILTLQVTCSIATCFSSNYVMYTILRSINGLTFPAIFQIPFILAIEIISPKYRTFAGMTICLFFALALMILAGLSYIFNTWFSLATVTSFPFLILLSFWFFVPESPRWLLTSHRITEAENIIQSIATMNKKTIPSNFLLKYAHEKIKLSREKESQNFISNTESTVSSPHILTVIKNCPTTRRNFLLITFNWLTNAMVYNGLSFYSANLHVSTHLGFFISSLVEIPACGLGIIVMDKLGRRLLLFLTMVTGGLSCISCIFVPSDSSPWITVALAMIGKFQIALSFAVIYVYAGELMPTVLRSEAMGVSSFIAGVGLLVFPYINILGSMSTVLPLVIMGSLSILGGVLALFLPETLHRNLPNSLSEAEAFETNFNVWSSSCCSSSTSKMTNESESMLEETVLRNILESDKRSRK